MQTTTINASELRIGNLRQVNGKYVNAVNGATIGHIEMGILDFIPIELTEKRLADFGFFKMGTRWYLNDESHIFTSNFSHDNGGFFIWIGGFKKYIRYVHELQNVFFCLTGTELKRKCDE